MPDNPQTFEIPPMSAFFLDADHDQVVWMQCSKCLENWTVITLHDAVHEWNEHVCKKKGGAIPQN